MSTPPEQLAAEPQPPPSLMPELPAPPGVAVATSEVQGRETTAGQLNELLSSSSPYLQQARGRATQYSASRGLQNSSIAGQAGEQAAIAAAAPIAESTAGAYERRELARLDSTNQFGLVREQGNVSSRLQSEGHTQTMEQQAAAGNISSRLQQEQAAQRLIEQSAAGDIASRQMMEQFGFDSRFSAQENIQRLQQLAAQGDLEAKARLENFQNQSRLLTQETEAQYQTQQRDIAAKQWAAQFDAATQKELQGFDLATRERMQAAGFTQEQVLQAAEAQQQQWLASFDADTRVKLQGMDADVRLAMQGLDVETQERIANINVSSAARGDAARMLTSMELGYSSMLATIMNNPDIPAAERQTYMDHAAAQRDSNLALVEQMFAIDLDWGA